MPSFSLCPTCGGAVSPRVAQCPHCGEPFLQAGPAISAGPTIRAVAPSVRRPPAKRSPTMTCLVVFFVGFGGLIVLAMIGAIMGPDTTSTGTETEAWSRAREIVTAQLKAPATAEFPWTEWRAREVDGTWHVASYVDSQNSFGAMIRSEWVCILARRHGQWECQYLVIDGQVIIAK